MTMGEVSGAGFTLGTAFRPGTVAEDAVHAMVSVLDAQDAAPSIERLRGWALSAGAVRLGETCVDLGSGTGTMTRRLARLVGPDGRVVGIEPNGMLRTVAAERAARAGTAIELCQGLATEIPMPDESVDVVWCERVLQHVPDPRAALVEIARVLRPGGRALLLDSDHASRVDSDIDPAVAAAMLDSFMGQLANPLSARQLPRLAIEAGLEVDPDIGSSALVYPQEVLVGSELTRLAADQAVSEGRITREQADEAMRSQSAAARSGWAFSAITVFGFVCRKP
ncbi:methyltransferase domain-containing protein [Nocardioides mangrovi]|uniref:Methyltransferase domain-containing protein n=1 Tax=Nocardioides mangrovi TaxID=2874580 RepID=A0ABS7U9J1_9ACTN|nr:methyltransferase domain-containing protein [Nocardioides mangrovi]MBZ5737651.1 methyltransferase domain-containing protein [Nocardioides mangrovi]